jgi:hypothetical protein
MEIVETPIFTRRVLETLTDEQYRELQLFRQLVRMQATSFPAGTAFESFDGQ